MAKKSTASKSAKPIQPARTEKPAKNAAKQPAPPKAVTEQASATPEPHAAKPDAQAKSQTPTPNPKSKPSAASKPPLEAKSSPGGLTAACTFLAQAKEPMRVKDLTEALIKKGLWSPKGKTPHSTLAAAIGREIKDKGKDSRFKKTGRGLFSTARAKA